MSIAAALELIIMIVSAIAEAKKEGRDTIELMEQAKNLDDDARAALVAAISVGE